MSQALKFIGAVAVGLFVSGCPDDTDLSAARSSALETRAAAAFEEMRDHPPLMRAFLKRMPKGADLHTHLSGAVYAENYVIWAAEDGLCIDVVTFVLTAPCKDGQLAEKALTDDVFLTSVVDAWSMRNHGLSDVPGDRQFFDAFGKFGEVSGRRTGDMLAAVLERAAAQGVVHMEILMTFGEPHRFVREKGYGPELLDDLGAFRDRLLEDFAAADLFGKARGDLDKAEERMRAALQCGSGDPHPACEISPKYIAQVKRTGPPQEVFAQAVFNFAIIRQDHRILGLNFVAPENHPVALRDYALHMRMLNFLHEKDPDVNITLHAGELTFGLVPPKHLRSHIGEAVRTAGARRIGHGVAVMHEDNPIELLRDMAGRKVLVEILLTSNDQILGVRGNDHPFPIYRKYGVPVALATDDEGISRSDLTNEFQRAAQTYGLGYRELKVLARNSLEYSFLPGDSLWRPDGGFAVVAACANDQPGGDAPSDDCSDLLKRSERARVQWKLERDFAAFEELTW